MTEEKKGFWKHMGPALLTAAVGALVAAGPAIIYAISNAQRKEAEKGIDDIYAANPYDPTRFEQACIDHSATLATREALHNGWKPD
jgi:hypothetical protein